MPASTRIACLLLPSSFDPENLPALAEACFRFSPQIALKEGQGVFIEIGGSRNLFSEESFLMRLLSLAGRFTESAGSSRVAVADSVPEALAFARFHGRKIVRDRHAFRALPVSALRDFASPFGEGEDRLREADRIAQLLRVLGVETLGGFFDLPRATLASRLGKGAIELHARVAGELPLAWPGFHPLASVIEKTFIEESGENLEALGFVFKGLLDRAMARLRGRAQRAAVIQLALDLERWSTSELRREWRLEFPVPQGSSHGALPLVLERLRFELEREPLTSPARALSVEILETAPGRGAQSHFFDKSEEQDEELDSLFARLVQRLGTERAFIANPVSRHLPEGAFERIKPGEGPREKKEKRESKGSKIAGLPERPLRVLPKPELLEVRGPLLATVSAGKKWLATGWNGPERISGEWWRDTAFDRDYYRVATETGQDLWVYSERGSERETRRYFLHGFFD